MTQGATALFVPFTTLAAAAEGHDGKHQRDADGKHDGEGRHNDERYGEVDEVLVGPELQIKRAFGRQHHQLHTVPNGTCQWRTRGNTHIHSYTHTDNTHH